MISILIGERGNGGDISREDYERLVEVVARANEAANLSDPQLQRIETMLDSVLMLVRIEDES